MFPNGTIQKRRGALSRARPLLVLAPVLSALLCSPWNSSRSYGLPSPVRDVVEVHVSIQRPLVSLDFAATVLNVTSDQVREFIQDGSLLFAWDLSRKQTRPLVRIWAQCLVDYVSQKAPLKMLPDPNVILDQIFPNHGTKILAHEISRRWSCDPEHVTNLLRAGLLRKAPGSECRSGRNGSPMIDFASIVAFMEERQMV